MSSEVNKSIFNCYLSPCVLVYLSVWFIHLTSHVIGPGRLATFCPDSCQGHSSSLATCCGGRGDKRLQPITREPIGAAKRATRQTKNRDETLLLRTLNFNLEVTSHVSVQGPVKHPKLGPWTLAHRVGRLSPLSCNDCAEAFFEVLNYTFLGSI